MGAARSHAIRGMSSPPLAFVRLIKDLSSKRDKLVCLTGKGEQFLAAMEERGRLALELVERERSPMNSFEQGWSCWTYLLWRLRRSTLRIEQTATVRKEQ
jgi:hypothetical protein